MAAGALSPLSTTSFSSTVEIAEVTARNKQFFIPEDRMSPVDFSLSPLRNTDQVVRSSVFSDGLTPEQKTFIGLTNNFFASDEEKRLDGGQLAKICKELIAPEGMHGRRFPDLDFRWRANSDLLSTINPRVKEFLTPDAIDVLEEWFKTEEGYTSDEIVVLCFPVSKETFERLYSDDEILQVLEDKNVLFQGIIGADKSVQAAATMLARDVSSSGLAPKELRSSDSNFECVIDNELRKVGITCTTHYCLSVKELSSRISKQGPAVVILRNGYAAVVDSIEADRVTLKDPRHGWAVALKKDAFCRIWDSNSERLAKGEAPLVMNQIYQVKLPQ